MLPDVCLDAGVLASELWAHALNVALQCISASRSAARLDRMRALPVLNSVKYEGALVSLWRNGIRRLVSFAVENFETYAVFS